MTDKRLPLAGSPSDESLNANARPFMRLLNATELMPGNASRTCLELERD